MPRLPRIDAPGLLQHIIARGVNRCLIFREKADYENFLKRIEQSLQKSPNQILAWCLMPNHFHFLVRSGQSGIASLMRRLLTGYAGVFNKKYKRTGHLFQNRYKSIVCEEDSYLLELIRYIHLNPLRAGLIENIAQLINYPYSGHVAIMGTRNFKWQVIDEVLNNFGANMMSSRKNYEKFLCDGITQNKLKLARHLYIKKEVDNDSATPNESNYTVQKYDSRILGSEAFSNNVLQLVQNSGHIQTLFNDNSLKLEAMASRIATEFGINANTLFSYGRTHAVSKSKALFIYIGVQYLGKTTKEMAEFTKMSISAACKARYRGESLFQNSQLRQWLQEKSQLS